MKHGLTGEGVALPHEDYVAIQNRYSALSDELAPTTEMGRILAERFAFLSVRLERCERHETTMISKRVRQSMEAHDDTRMADVELHISRIDHEPMTSSRRLQSTPEGIDWLIANWEELRADLMIEDRLVWTPAHWGRAERLMGNPEGSVRVNRSRALTEAVCGFFANLDPSDGGELDDAARSRWARHEIAKDIDAEVYRLIKVRESLDHETIERERLEAPDRATFDASPEMILARRYEAATERAMYKALKEFREIESLAQKQRESDTKNSLEKTCEILASSGDQPAERRVTTHRTPPPSPEIVVSDTIEVAEHAEKVAEFVEIARC